VALRKPTLDDVFLGQGALPPGRTVTGQVLLALAWSAAIIAVFTPLAVRLYRRSVG
jgi:ABC-2 type transport system permease protein/oleandomycin transport system permease protein